MLSQSLNPSVQVTVASRRCDTINVIPIRQVTDVVSSKIYIKFQQVRTPEEHVELGESSVTLMLWLIPPLPRYQRGNVCQPRDQPRYASKVDLDHGYDLSA